MGSPVIFTGDRAKTLTKNFRLGGDTASNDVDITKETTNPNSTSRTGNAGSLAVQSATQKLWQKLATGDNTKWKELTNQMDVLHEIHPDWYVAADWGEGTNATFDGGGADNNLLTRSTTAADLIDGVAAWTYATTTTNTYFVFSALDIPQGKRGNFIGFVFDGYRFDGTTGNFAFRVKDTTNGTILTDDSYTFETYIDATDNTAKRKMFVVFIPSDCQQIEIGGQTLTGVASTEFQFGRISIVENPFKSITDSTVTGWSTPTTNTITSTGTNPTKGTIVRDRLMYRLVGDTLQVHIDYEQSTGGTAGTGTYLFALPSGFTVNSSLIDLDTSVTRTDLATNTLGINTASTGSAHGVGAVKAYDATTVAFTVDATNADFVRAANFDLSNATAKYSAIFEVPVNEGQAASFDAYAFNDVAVENKFWATVENTGAAANILEENINILSPTRNGTGRIDFTFQNIDFGGVIPGVEADVIVTTAGNGDRKATVSNVSTSGFTVFVEDLSNVAQDEDIKVEITRNGTDYRHPARSVIVPSTLVCYLKDLKASNTAGGASVAGTQTRDLNTVEGDSSFVSLSGNQFTLGPGKYNISSVAPAREVNSHRSLIYDTGAAAAVIEGTTGYSASGEGHDYSFCDGQLVLNAPETFELRHITQTAKATNGLGVASNLGNTEVYSVVKIEKVL